MAEHYPNIKKARLKSGKDFSKLLEALGMDEAEYFRYENGQKTWVSELLVILADHYGASVDYLLGIAE